MKGIILAGGSGTRLFPLTRVACKQLLPVYDKPMIFYPLSTLMLAGLKDILIISTPKDIGGFNDLLGDGRDLGINISYAVQVKPNGIAQALILAEEFLDGGPSCLILGDNIFHGEHLGRELEICAAGGKFPGAQVFAYHVPDPERYGVVEIERVPFAPSMSAYRAVSIEEKPEKPKSNLAVTGLYFYDEHAPTIVKKMKPSARGELEITDLNKWYLNNNLLTVNKMGRGTVWLDTGTHESLAEASDYIRVVEKRSGLKIGCIEEIAYRKKFITRDQLLILAKRVPNGYGEYLNKLAGEGHGQALNGSEAEEVEETSIRGAERTFLV